MSNLILDADSYKYSHPFQYPKGTTYVSSYIEARGVGKDFPNTDSVVFFGLQAWLKSLSPITLHKINKAEDLATRHGEPFYRAGWEHILNKHGGILPVMIHARKEGFKYKLRTPLVQITNTDPEAWWLPSFLETSLLRSVWYPSTIATLSATTKDMMRYWWTHTVDSDARGGLDFALHDFGARGVSSRESAMLGGMGHLLSFRGTDTVSAIQGIWKFYDDGSKEMPAFSVPAAEHSTITSWGMEGEQDAYENLIETFGKPGSIFSIVCDSYDYQHAVRDIFAGSLLEKIKNCGGKLVIRPDSGDPVTVVMDILSILEEKLGDEITRNKMGCKVLPPYFGLLQGDGVSYDEIKLILRAMSESNWAASNIVFGMGGGLLQKVNRDSLKWAMKCNAIKIGDKGWKPVAKVVKSDPTKASFPGHIPSDPGNFDVVWRDGELARHWTFDDLRTNLLTS